jgi:transcriptional regulator GlxA family with amidase domain
MRNRIMADRAEAMLAETDLSVEEIAGELGFGNAAYFRKVFKQVKKRTPLSVRRNARLI